MKRVKRVPQKGATLFKRVPFKKGSDTFARWIAETFHVKSHRSHVTITLAPSGVFQEEGLGGREEEG